jgi:hypothetical protein
MRGDAAAGEPGGPVAPAPHRSPWRRRIGRGAATVALAVLLLGTTGWSVLAVDLADRDGAPPRTLAAVAVAAAALATLTLIKPRRLGVLACLGIFVVVAAWFFTRQPSNDREWRPETAQVPTAEIDGDRVTIHHVRNFDWRSEADFTPRWETRTYDLARLRGVDFMLVHWGSKAIAHAMVSFGFDDGDQLAVSIEARMQRTESYSAIDGFFRQFELVYVFGDERDLVRLRTNHRHEDVYLYPTTLTAEQGRLLLRSYLARANELARHPEFYNALTSNCATNVLENAQAVNLPATMSWKILASGYAVEQLYENRRINTSLPLESLVAHSRVNEAASRADADPQFSRRIREGLPPFAAVSISMPP